jgi:hypothetical protein
MVNQNKIFRSHENISKSLENRASSMKMRKTSRKFWKIAKALYRCLNMLLKLSITKKEMLLARMPSELNVYILF